MTRRIFGRFDPWEAMPTWSPSPHDGPIIMGCNNSEASARALAMACSRFSGADVIVVTATTGRHRVDRPTAWNDTLKADAYLLTDDAITREFLRHAREMALRAGARSATALTETGDPVTVLNRVADGVGASAVVIGMTDRPGWLAGALRRRLDGRSALVVTDGTTHLRPRRQVARGAPLRRPVVRPVGFAPS